MKKTKPLPKWSGRENPAAKAALLSGPPGIGKSSTASIVAEHLNYEIFELNASDARSKRTLGEKLAQVTQTQLLNFGGNKFFTANGTKKKRLIIMDEVDGMSSGDRGGMAELIKIIKTSKANYLYLQ